MVHLANFLKYIILFSLFSFLPFADLRELTEPTQTGKFIVFSGAVLGVLLLSAPLLIFRKSFLAIKFLDLLVLFLYLFITLNRYVIQEKAAFSMAYYELSGLVCLYLILRSEKQIRLNFWLILAIVMGGLLQAVYGNLQLYGFYYSNHSLFNLTGGFFNPGPFGGYLATTVPASLGLFLFRKPLAENSFDIGIATTPSKDSITRTVIAFMSVLSFLAVFLVLGATRSRAAWLSTAGSSVCILFYYYGLNQQIGLYFRTTGRKVAGSFAILLTAFFVLLGLYKINQNSVDGRFLIWKATASMIAERPLTGHGFDGFKSVYMDYQSQYFRTPRSAPEIGAASDITYAFNEYLQFISESGVLGAFLLFSLILLLFATKSNGNALIIISKGGLISILVFSFFSYPSQILPIKLNGLLYASVLVHQQSKTVFKCAWVRVSTLKIFLIRSSLMLIVVGFVIFYVTRLQNIYHSYAFWKKAFFIYENGAYEASLPYYKESSQVFNKDGTFLLQYAKAYALTGKHKRAVSLLKQAEAYQDGTLVQLALGESYKSLKQYRLAERAYLKSYYMAPGLFYPRYQLAKLYILTGEKEKAILTARQLLAQKIKINSPAVQQILAEMAEIIN